MKKEWIFCGNTESISNMPAVIQPHCITDPLTQSNCYILTAESHALIIDPNCYQEIHSYLASHQLVPEYIILTHEHCDHIVSGK